MVYNEMLIYLIFKMLPLITWIFLKATPTSSEMDSWGHTFSFNANLLGEFAIC